MMYHVTFTKYVQSIRRHGLRIMARPTNWVRQTSGERYGGRHIYAFEHPDDAMRWAAKQDWDYHKQTGSGKIAIVCFERGDEQWEVDGADPLFHHRSKGRWMRCATVVGPKQITSVKIFSQKDAKELVLR
jgi:hypothetical protein